MSYQDPRLNVVQLWQCLVVGIFVGYLTTLACEPGAEYLAVFRVAGTAAIMAHTLGSMPHAILFRTRETEPE